VETKWVGRVSGQELREYAAVDGLILTDFVPDVRPYLAGAECVIVPLRVGGGTRIKILDAWAMGKAVVSTSIGCEGLDARDRENILIADNPREFAAAISRIMTNEALKEQLGRNGRETVARYYSWDIIGRNMLTEYRRLMQ
jgi:glycosyltransferase involved in cell wall biosynthesis